MSVPGKLIVCCWPREMPDERRARQAALEMKDRFAGRHRLSARCRSSSGRVRSAGGPGHLPPLEESIDE